MAAWPAAAAGFAVTSPGLADGATLPPAQAYQEDGCGGANRSPALDWTNPPSGTQSLAVTMFDPDARGGEGWWHWALLDLPSAQRHLAEGTDAPAEATTGRNDFGGLGYGGACPPNGDRPHHYLVTIWALDAARLPFAAGAPDGKIGVYLRQHATAKAKITFRYGR